MRSLTAPPPPPTVSASCAAHNAVVAPVEGCVYTQLLASLRAGEGAPCLVRSVERGALRNRRRCIFRICSDNSGGLSCQPAAPRNETATIVVGAYSEWSRERHFILRISKGFQEARQLLFQRLQHVSHVRFSPFDSGRTP